MVLLGYLGASVFIYHHFDTKPSSTSHLTILLSKLKALLFPWYYWNNETLEHLIEHQLSLIKPFDIIEETEKCPKIHFGLLFVFCGKDSLKRKREWNHLRGVSLFSCSVCVEFHVCCSWCNCNYCFWNSKLLLRTSITDVMRILQIQDGINNYCTAKRLTWKPLDSTTLS